MRSSLFWNITQRRLVVTEVSGRIMGPTFHGSSLERLSIEDETDRLPRKVGN